MDKEREQQERFTIDPEMLARLKAYDADAWEKLSGEREHFMRMARANGVPLDQCEDIVQTALFNFSRKMNDLEGEDPDGYIFRTIKNLSFNVHRRAHRKPSESLEAKNAQAESHQDIARLAEIREELKEAQQKAPTTFIHSLGYPIKDIAKAKGTTEGAVKATMNRERKVLVKMPTPTLVFGKRK